MRIFFKYVFATTFGIFIFISLFLISLFAILFFSFKDENKISVNENSILEIKLDQQIIESYYEQENDLINLNENNYIQLKSILDAINKSKNDPNIKAISLKLYDSNSGITQYQEIRDAIADFKKSGKWVYAYLNNADQKSYFLATIADKIYLNPNGNIQFFGLSSEVLFYKNLGEKYGINFNVIRHGQYKSAVEPFITNQISQENKTQISELLSDVWQNISNQISKDRKIQINELNKIADSLYSFIPEKALKSKLIDGLLFEGEYNKTLKIKMNDQSENDLPNTISLNDYIKTNYYDIYDNSIAILYASGEIFDGTKESQIHSENFKEIIREIKNDKSIKALVLRVNSPGGSANASAEILHELKLLRKEKPIITSFSDLAASGGYYISMESDRIFAYPTTITGSIGVLGMIPDVKKLANSVGINSEIVQTHSNSYFFSPTYGLSEDAKKIMTLSVESTYNQFLKIVSVNRKLSINKTDSLAKGRVWSGTKALQSGLIDEFGTLQKSIDYAAKKSNLKEYNILTFPRETTKIQRLLNSFQENDYAKSIIKKELSQEEYNIYNKIKSLQKQKGILMLAPFEIKF